MRKKKELSQEKLWAGVILAAVAIGIITAPLLIPPKTRWQKQMERVRALHQVGKRKEAIPLAQKVIASAQELYGKNSLQAQQARELLLEIYRYEKEPALMKPLAADIEKGYLEEKAKLEEVDGPNRRETINVMINLAQLYHRQQRYVESEKVYLDILDRIERGQGPNAPEKAMVWYLMINLYNAEGKFDQSELLYGKILVYYETRFGSENVALKDPLKRMVEFYRQIGNEPKAKQTEERIASLR